ncbi:transposase, partial [Bacillus wiedmannii]|nr:transposase [Bacillus wiedmannii]
MKHTQQAIMEEIRLHEQLQQELLTYPEKSIHEDGSVTIEQIQDPYFLVNDKWNVERLGEIKQFHELVSNYMNLKRSRKICFSFANSSINLEVKYIFYRRIFNEEWSINTTFGGIQHSLRLLIAFINQKYPKLSSLLDLEIEKVEQEWIFWLNENGKKTTRMLEKYGVPSYNAKSKTAGFLRLLYSKLFILTDNRDEWEKERWDVRVLYERYGISYNKSGNTYM